MNTDCTKPITKLINFSIKWFILVSLPRNDITRAEEMVLQLKAPAVLTEDLSSIPSTYTAAHNCDSRSWVLETLIQTHKQQNKSTYRHKHTCALTHTL